MWRTGCLWPAIKKDHQMIDFAKPVQTRDEQDVRILCMDGPNPDFPVVGFIDDDTKTYSWAADGVYDGGNAEWLDLVNFKPPKFVNVYSIGAHNSRDDADAACLVGQTRIACLEFKDGDGLHPESTP